MGSWGDCRCYRHCKLDRQVSRGRLYVLQGLYVLEGISVERSHCQCPGAGQQLRQDLQRGFFTKWGLPPICPVHLCVLFWMPEPLPPLRHRVWPPGRLWHALGQATIVSPSGLSTGIAQLLIEELLNLHKWHVGAGSKMETSAWRSQGGGSRDVPVAGTWELGLSRGYALQGTICLMPGCLCDLERCYTSRVAFVCLFWRPNIWNLSLMTQKFRNHKIIWCLRVVFVSFVARILNAKANVQYFWSVNLLPMSKYVVNQ